MARSKHANEFRRYLNDDSRPMRSNKHQERLEEREGSLLPSLLKVGLAAGTLYGIYRSRILARPLGFLTIQVGNYRSRYVEAPIECIENCLQKRANSSLTDEIAEAVERRAAKEVGPLHGRRTAFEELLLERNRFKELVKERATLEMRFEDAIEYLQSEMSEEGFAKLQDAIPEGPSGMRQLLTGLDFDQLMRRTLSEEDYRIFALRPDFYRELSTYEFEVIEKNLEFIEEQFRRAASDKFDTSKPTFIEKLTNLRRMTVRDLYERGLTDKDALLDTLQGSIPYNIEGQIKELAEELPEIRIWPIPAFM